MSVILRSAATKDLPPERTDTSFRKAHDLEMLTLARHAMATRFELVLAGDDEARLRAAGEEALAEVARLDALLSFYRPTSEIGRINASAAQRPVRVAPEVFALLARAVHYHAESDGAFDVTVGPLVQCWRAAGAAGRLPDADVLSEARARVGMQHVELDAETCSIRFRRPGVLLDLGAIGKGYAIEQAALRLAELGVACALLHGGTSTVHALGAPPDAAGWKVAIERPGGGAEREPLAVVELCDRALSVSAAWGRSFSVDGVEYGHVLDPRLGRPTRGAQLAAVVCSSATEADALSTALLTLGPERARAVTAARPQLEVLVLGEDGAHAVEAGRSFVAPLLRMTAGHHEVSS